MKKVLFGLVLLFGAVSFTTAQVNPHAIGLRLGTGYGFGTEISYQHGFGTTNRLEADLGLNDIGFNLTGVYHWDWNIVSGLNWFVGPGATVGMINSKYGGGINVGIGGQIGLEYDFKTLGAPILLSLDSRPMYNFGKPTYTGYNNFGWGADLSVRYVW